MDDLPSPRALADAALCCPVLHDANRLAEWVGDGKPVTAKGVLRRKDVPAAGCALGIEVPDRVRTAADVPALHRPWTAALITGLLVVADGRAVAGQALAGWPPDDEEAVLDHWLQALAGSMTTTFDEEGEGKGARDIARLALIVLGADQPPVGDELLRTISYVVIHDDGPAFDAFAHGHGVRDPSAVVVDLLSDFGAATAAPGRQRITPLGRWALSALANGCGVVAAAPTATPLPSEHICQLKIALKDVRPPCWRRVLVPASATLGDLHVIIQIVLDWDDDHLHAFTVGRHRYGDPAFDMERDEDKLTLSEAFAGRRRTISYVYDFGDCWRHEITLERSLPPESGASYPVCVAGRGDAPVEDCADDEPDGIPFDQAGINARLGEVREQDTSITDELDKVISTILVDCCGEAEEANAFRTVLGEEIEFPVPATLLDASVIVTGFDDGAATLELRSRCRGRQGQGTVAFADLTFPRGTVASWLHAAYLRYLGRIPHDATPPW